MTYRLFSSAMIVSLLVNVNLRAQNPLDGPAPVITYSGDGMTIVVREFSEERGAVSGEIRKDGAAFPFTGRLGQSGNNEVVEGSFTANGQSFPFRSVQHEDEQITFTTGGKSYKLKPVQTNDPAPVAKPAPPNPLEAKPRQKPPAPASAQPETLKLKRVEFRDVTMGNVVAYTMLIPHDWTADGHIEWSTGDNVYPQPKIQITSPVGAKIGMIPAMSFQYTEMKPVPGFQQIPPQGTPPPHNIGEWVAEKVRQTNTAVTDVRLVSDTRDTKAEAAAAKVWQELGSNTAGVQNEIHVVTIAYVKDGVPYRDEINLTYSHLPPIDNQNLRSQMWMVFVSYMIGAPQEQFEKLKPQLTFYAGTYQATAKWWTQMQRVLMEISRNRLAAVAEQIRRRAADYDSMSEAQHNEFKKRMASGDRAQNERMNSIYEVDDFKDRDGSTVKLPFHYPHVYSDGNGNYLLTNSTLNKPDSQFEEIRPAPNSP